MSVDEPLLNSDNVYYTIGMREVCGMGVFDSND